MGSSLIYLSSVFIRKRNLDIDFAQRDDYGKTHKEKMAM